MKIQAVTLSFALVLSPMGPAARSAEPEGGPIPPSAGSQTAAPPSMPVSTAAPAALSAPTLTVEERPGEKRAAAGPEDETTRALKAVRAAGSATAGVGFGLFGYAVVAEAFGPVGWAAALIFVGGMAAVLAHRRLQGEEDFASPAARSQHAPPAEAVPAPAPPGRPAPAAPSPANPPAAPPTAGPAI